MQKKYAFALAALFVAVTSLNVVAQNHNCSECFSWYTVPTKNEVRPTSFEAGDIIKNYNCVYLGREDKKRIYLTFDAGYENGNVEKTLDALKKHEVKGAFFVLPHFIKQNPLLIKRMIDEGHLVCNHTTSHRDMSKINSAEQFQNELLGVEEIFREQTGKEMSKFYRPPEGRFSEENLKTADKLGYTTVFWSLAYADWDNDKQMDPEKAKQLILSRVHNGCVMLLHPTSSTNATILDDLIVKLKERGYEFCSLDEFE
ncbi:MAG: delta-lactam-biosynthetic de-N-acetylase [Ruminococcaceae bacterium]|nr:delta-lactam-biosynthetic de-N-acetylase [Oscillospiraceae bacterium]